ncbi:MAG TPA: aspartyl/asparaginyl beta-hydroxylase domain-containing protein [Steroidobacteraceae bacterium]
MIGQNDDRRIRQLIETAAQASASGRAQEADRLVRQAEAESPRHPLVLNEIARRLLMSGDAAGAHGLLAQAVSQDPSHASIWLNLAAALRGLKRVDEEMAAIDKVLSLEPRNLRAMLQKASLQEIQGKPRAAAMTYRYVLQSVPSGSLPPQSLRPVFQHALQFVAANDRELEQLLESRLKSLRERHKAEPLERFDRCLETLLRKKPVYRPQPSFMYFPRLPAIEFYDRSEFPWLDSIEAATDDIRSELVNVLQEGPAALMPYVDIPAGMPLDQWRELNQSRRWGVYYLWQEGVAIPEHIARFPRTVAALEAWPRCDVPGCSPTAVFSILDAKTRIPAHTGVSNTRLIVHLPLIVPPGCGFRVGAERREWDPGKAFVFDDTFEHEAWNDSDVPRAVLILDIWSPHVSLAERDMVRQVTADVGEFYGTGSYHEGGL